MEIITSKENSSVKLYQKLAASRKERGKHNMFVLEGARIVEDALKEKRNVKYLIITQQALKKYKSISQADLNNARLIVISNELGNKISQTENPQGIFAICDIPEQKPISLKGNGKYVALCGIQDPGNMGMIIRSADALGIDGIIISGCCDLYNPKVIRAAMGSVFRIDIYIESDINKVFYLMEENKIKSYAAVVGDGAVNINNVNLSGGCAVFIGNEGNGLSNEIAGKCGGKITIPMHGTINSLNAAMAAGILMWELKRDE